MTLHDAARGGDLDALRALIEAGAPLNTSAEPREPDRDHLPDGPAAEIVIRYGLIEWVGSIVGGKGSVTPKRNDQNGPTPLMIASAAGQADAVDVLLDAGASVDLRDRDGFTALSYAFDTGQDELAELLIEAGAGEDPISAAYVRARSFPDLAKGEEFQELVQHVAGLCDAEPKPLTSMPTHKDFQTLHRGGPFPTGPTIGAAFNVPRERAHELIVMHQEKLRRRGAFLVIAEHHAGNFDFNRQALGLVPTGDKDTVIAALCGAGTDWGWVCPAFTIRDLQAIEPAYPFRLIGCARRSLDLEFATPIADVNDLAIWLNAIKTTLWASGMPECPDLEDVIESLRRSPRIQFGWE